MRVMQWVLAAVLALGLGGLATGPAAALSIDVESRMVPEMGSVAGISVNRLRLTGPFEKGDAGRLRTILEALRGRGARAPDGSLAVAELSSGGGDILEGIKIGYLFREFDVATLVKRGDRCMSACAIAFLGGTARHSELEALAARRIEIGGQVAFHNIFLNYLGLKNPETSNVEVATKQGFDLALSASSSIVRYVTDMGIAPGFIARLLGSPTENFDYVESVEAFSALGICPTDSFMPKVTRERQVANICSNALGWSKADPGQVTQMPPREARIFLLTLLQNRIVAQGASDRLAAQLEAALLNTKDDVLLSQIYDSLRRAGVRLPELYGGLNEVAGYNAGPYKVSCEVTLSANEPDRYDVVIVGPNGIRDAPRSAPRECRWLYRFGARDLINPKP